MITYEVGAKSVEQYDYVSTNQYGDRYKRLPDKYVGMCNLSTTIDDARGLAGLVYLSDRLQIPIKWNVNTDPQTASISVVAADEV